MNAPDSLIRTFQQEFTQATPDHVNAAFQARDEREREILTQRFGPEAKSRIKIAKAFGVTADRIRQLENVALTKMKGHIYRALNPVPPATTGPYDNVRLEKLEMLSIRSQNCLANNDLETVGQLREKEAHELLKFQNFGKKCLRECREALKALGAEVSASWEE